MTKKTLFLALILINLSLYPSSWAESTQRKPALSEIMPEQRQNRAAQFLGTWKNRVSHFLKDNHTNSAQKTSFEQHACPTCNHPFLSDNIPLKLYTYITCTSFLHASSSVIVLFLVEEFRKHFFSTISKTTFLAPTQLIFSLPTSILFIRHIQNKLNKNNYSFTWKPLTASLITTSLLHISLLFFSDLIKKSNADPI